MSANSYRLERLNWRRHEDQLLLLPGADRVADYANPDEAADECRRREWELRRRINPFRCGGPYLHYQTSLDPARFYDWCLDAGLEPPGLVNESPPWAAWWQEHFPAMTDLQRASMWEALDRIRFYRTVEAEHGMACHLVARPHTDFDPIGPHHVGYAHVRHVGCTPDMLSRSRATADRLCHELFVHRLAAEGGYVGLIQEPTSWEIPDEDPFASSEAPLRSFQYEFEDYAERRPIGLIAGSEPIAGQTLFVVLRRHWRLEVYGDAWRWSLTQARTCGRPILAYDTLAAADASIALLESEARESSVPFRFGPPHEWSNLNPSTIWGMLYAIAPIPFANQWTDYKATDHVWCQWWDDVRPTLRAEEIETAWSLYDRLRFYEVASVEYRE